MSLNRAVSELNKLMCPPLICVYRMTSCPFISAILSNHLTASSDESAKIKEHMGSPFSFKNLLTLITLVLPSGRVRSVDTKVILHI